MAFPMNQAELQHQTVLLDEAISALAIDGERASGLYVDGTFGRGGHSRKLLSELSPQGRLIAFDKDLAAIGAGKALEANDARFSIIHDSFATMKSALAARGLTQVDGILLDLGISSPQVDDPERGFSFRLDGPLDMRMDTTRGISAADWLASESAENIEKVIREYGEERFSFAIAKAIVARRQEKPIATTHDLAKIVSSVIGRREKNKDPATRTFQAIRIYVNQELNDLGLALEAAFQLLAPNGRLVVISFHSLEDRMVKRFMAEKTRAEQPDRRLPIRAKDLPTSPARLVNKKKPSTEEVASNTRARSAIMRTCVRLNDAQEKEALR